MDTEVQLRDMEPEEISQTEAGRSSTKSGITETEKQSNCATETANSSLAIDLLIPNDMSEEMSEKAQENNRSFTAEVLEEFEKPATTVANNGGMNETDSFLQTLIEIDSVHGPNHREKSIPKSPRKRKLLMLRGNRWKRKQRSSGNSPEKKSIKFETIKTLDEPKDEIALLSSPNLIESDSILNEGTRNNASEVVGTNDDNASGIKDEFLDEILSSTTSMSNDFIPKTGDVLKHRGRPPKKRNQSKVTKVSTDSESRASSRASTEVLSSSNSAKNKFVPKCRRSLAKVIKVQSMKANANDDTASSNKDTLTEISLTISLQSDSMSEDLVPKITSTPKCRGRGRGRGKCTKKAIATEVPGINNAETKSKISRDATPERLKKIDTTIEEVIQLTIRASQPEELTEETKPAKTEVKTEPMLEKTNNPIDNEFFIMYEEPAHSKSKAETSSKNKAMDKLQCRSRKKPTKSIDNIPTSKMKHNTGASKQQMNETENASVRSKLKRHSCQNILAEVKQPRVLLFDIAYSDKLTPNQKEMLSRMKTSDEFNVNSRNLPVSSANQSISQSATVDIMEAPLELEKTSVKPKQSVSRKKVKALENEPCTPEKYQRLKTPKITTQSNIAKQQTKPTSIILLSPRNKSMPGIEVIKTASEIDFFSSSGSSNTNSQQKLRPFDQLFFVRGSPIQWPNAEPQLTGPVALDRKGCGKQSVFETDELEVPLNLSIRSSNKSMDCQSDVFKSPDSSVVKSASKTSNSLLLHHQHALDTTTISKTEFGRSVSNVTNPNTFLTNVQYYKNLSKSRITSESRIKSDVNGNGKMQEIGNGKSKLSIAAEKTLAKNKSSNNYRVANEAKNVVKCKPVAENADAKTDTSSTRCLPKIVADEALPKGAIPFLSIGSKLAPRNATEDEEYLNRINKTQPYQEPFSFQLLTCSQNSQDNNILKTRPEKSAAKNDETEINSIGAEAYDSSELWKICPELENFFEDDDSINNNNISNIDIKILNINENNNNENELSNFDTLKTNEGMKNTDLLNIASREIVTDASDKNLSSNNNAAHIPETENDLWPVSAGVVATTVNYISSKLDLQSSESIVTEIKTEKKKPVVLANLTIANLTNFTKNSSCDGEKNRLNSFIEHYQCSMYSETEKKSESLDANKISNVCDETCIDARIVSTLENQNIHPPGKAKMKRKWMTDTSCERTVEKKRKLNRKISYENTEGNSMVICSFPIASSVASNNSQDSATIVINTKMLPDNTSCETTLSDEKVKEKAKIVEEIEAIRIDCNASQDHNLSIPDRNKIDKGTQSVETADVIVSEDAETIKYNEGNENLVKDETRLTIETILTKEESDTELDENGNSTSSSSTLTSSSSSSSSLSSKSTDSSGPTNSSNTINNAASLGKNNTCRDRFEVRKEQEEELNYEPDDCISLFAESIISTNIDETLNFINEVPSYDPPIKIQDSFHDMTDVVEYFEKNVAECNVAYESAIEMVENRRVAGPNNTPDDAFAYRDASNFDVFANSKTSMPKTNLEQKNLRKPIKYSAPYSPQDTFTVQENHSEPSVNLNSRFCVNTDLLDDFTFHPESRKLFRGHCYNKMRIGVCMRNNCRYSHLLSESLQNIDERDITEINQIFNYAIYHGYKYFTTHVYGHFFVRMKANKIFPLFCKLLKACHLNDLFIKKTVDSFASSGMPLRIIVKNIADQLYKDDQCTADRILSVVENLIEPGLYWETFRDLLVIKYPPIQGLHRVIEECVYTKQDKSHVRDVYTNYVRKFTVKQLSILDKHLKERFDSLVAENEFINEAENFAFDSPIVENANFYTVAETQDSAQCCVKQRCEIPTILSPDSIRQSDKVSQFLLQKDIEASQRSSSQGSFASRSLEKNETSSSSSKASTHHFFEQRRNIVSQVSSLVKGESPSLGIMTRKIEADYTFSGIYKLHPIDYLPAPKSIYRDILREYHLWITIVNDLLKNKSYKTVLDILDKYSDSMDKTFFTESLYNVLRKNVMTSACHLENMIKLSVEMRVGKFLSRTLFSLGIYTMIKLCDTGTWVLAYSLFKFLRNIGSLENTAAIILLSAEICLANGHSLKAFNMLKCNNMFTPNRSKWRVNSNTDDEHVRVRIISLLSDVLCNEYPEQALYLFKQLCREQGHTYYPTDLTAIIDKLVTGIMNGKCDESITDVGRFVLKSNFALGHRVFRNLLLRIFEKDAPLSKQLYHYGSWLGIYPIVKLTLPLRILIRTNWTKEEMNLVVVDFLEKLSMDVGPAIDRIGPNKFTVYLVFELAPFKDQLVDSEVEMRNVDELKISKQLMKAVLQEQFDPPINTINAEQERIIKLQSRSVVKYLKSMTVRQ